MSAPVFTPKHVIDAVLDGVSPQVWHEQYFARDYAVMGRVITRTPEGFGARDLLVATVNPNMPEGADVAVSIAEALNEKFTGGEAQ